VLCALVGVMFMRSKGKAPKPAIVGNVGCQAVVVTEQHRLAVTHLGELGRKGAVETPDPIRILNRETGMECWREGRGRIDPGIQVRGYTGIVSSIRGCRFGGDLNRYLREELSEALMCPLCSGRTPFNRSRQACLPAH